MFWSGNFTVVRELNFLLKEENVTLASVLEADDILQECKADNKALIQFLTRPDILAELITLITEEPPKNVELSQQYRHATIACEVLTSHLSTLSDRLTLDTAQMNRLCDFINKDPPLNPLLASYFSKTVEMLLERSPKQDWYLYHIVCLRVLDFFKSRRDFLPNLLRHISTSAIADTFKYLIRLDDLFNKPIMEWLEEHQFIDSLIQIICGTYVPEHFPGAEETEKGQREPSEKDHDASEGGSEGGPQESPPSSAECSSSSAGAGGAGGAGRAGGAAGAGARAAGVAADNAAALLCDLVATGCAGEGCATRSRTAWQLAGALGGCACVRAVLCHVFTCPPRHRAQALHHATRLLQTLLHHHTSENEEERCSVELAVAPHLPLLHQALLHDPAHYAQEDEGVGNAGDSVGVTKRVGSARVSTAALIAQLALSEVEEVATTLLTLGTPSVMLELMFEFPENNFLHAQVVALCRNALANRLYRTQYARHLFVECDLLTRLMDAFEDNEHKPSGSPRAGYMGHAVLLLGGARAALAELAAPLRLRAPLLQRWAAFQDAALAPVLLLHDTPLGGTYPSENIYDTGEELDNISDTLAANYDFSDMAATANMDDLGDDLATDHEMRNAEEHADSAEFIADGLGLDSSDKRVKAQNSFLELASQRFDDDMWDDAPDGDEQCARGGSDAAEVWAAPAWESGGGEVSQGGEGWAQFDAFSAPHDTFAAPHDTFAAPHDAQDAYAAYWPSDGDATESSNQSLEKSMRSLRLEGDKSIDDASTVELANNLLTAMSAMSPDAIANIVNANLQPLPLEPVEVNLPPEATVEVSTPPPVPPPAEHSSAPAPAASPSESCTSPAPPPRLPSPAEVTSSADLGPPNAVMNDTSSSRSHDDNPSDDPVRVNCVTVDDSHVTSKISTESAGSADGELNDLSPEDKVSVDAANGAAVDTNAIAVTDSTLQTADTGER